MAGARILYVDRDVSDDVSDHDELVESAALYALGALSGDERQRLEAHLQTCAACQAEARAFAAVVDRLAYAAPRVDPPRRLRSDILAALPQPRATTLRATRGSGSPGWLAAAAMLLVSVGLGAYAMTLRDRVRVLEQEIAEAQRSNEAARVRLAVLAAPDLTDVTLAGQAPAPGARGRAMWSRSQGLVFAASALPPLPSGRTYQLWYLTAGPPVSAGLVQPDPDGRALAFFPNAALSATPSGFAVSLEPEGGVPAPTGPIYLAGTQ